MIRFKRELIKLIKFSMNVDLISLLSYDTVISPGYFSAKITTKTETKFEYRIRKIKKIFIIKKPLN